MSIEEIYRKLLKEILDWPDNSHYETGGVGLQPSVSNKEYQQRLKRRKKSYSGWERNDPYNTRDYQLFVDWKRDNKDEKIIWNGIFKDRFFWIVVVDPEFPKFTLFGTIEQNNLNLGEVRFQTLNDWLMAAGVVLRPNFQDSGFGKILYSAALKWCKENGYKGIKGIAKHQMPRTQKLYQSLGGYVDDDGYATIEAK